LGIGDIKITDRGRDPVYVIAREYYVINLLLGIRSREI